MITFNVNGQERRIDADPKTPLLWVLRDTLGITSVKYTCGEAECGMCTVLIDGEPTRSCVIEAQDADGRMITTVEGLPADHPVKQAWIEKQVPQCGYCQPGIMLQATAFINNTPNPTDKQIDAAMNDVVCRCGSHSRIKQAIKLASTISARQRG